MDPYLESLFNIEYHNCHNCDDIDAPAPAGVYYDPAYKTYYVQDYFTLPIYMRRPLFFMAKDEDTMEWYVTYDRSFCPNMEDYILYHNYPPEDYTTIRNFLIPEEPTI